MILSYSSNDFSYKLGGSTSYIRRNNKGFYIDSEKEPSFFDNFIVLCVSDVFFVIATSHTDFIVYKITDKVEKALVIKTTKFFIENKTFEYVVLKLNNRLVKITPDLNFSKATSTKKKEIKSIEKFMELPYCDMTIECNLPIIYSIRTQVYCPYEGYEEKEFFFKI